MPLPLSPFEHYMLMDDSPHHPMVFAVSLTVDGTLDRNRFETAIAGALQRHPLLNATVNRAGDDVDWIESTGAGSAIIWNPSDSALRPFDLESETGLRILVKEFDESCRVQIQMHHACCDGIGAFQFIDDVLIALHNQSTGCRDPEWIAHREIDENALIERANISRKRSRWSVPHRLSIGIWRAIRFVVCQPVALTGRCQSESRSGNPGDRVRDQRPCIDRAFDSSVLTELRERAAAKSVTLNDYLMTLVFETLCDWSANTSGLRSGLVRVGIPINLRTRRHDNMSAANVVTMSYVDRTVAPTSDRNRSLRKISRQMHGIKSRKSATFVRLMRYLRKQKRMQRLISSDRVFQTAIFSNVGEILANSPLPRTDDDAIRIGDAVLRDVEIQAPVRSTMPVFFAVFQYAGRLKLCLTYDPTKFQREDAAELGDDLSRRILSICTADDMRRDKDAPDPASGPRRPAVSPGHEPTAAAASPASQIDSDGGTARI